jgi:hypothetical protein
MIQPGAAAAMTPNGAVVNAGQRGNDHGADRKGWRSRLRFPTPIGSLAR